MNFDQFLKNEKPRESTKVLNRLTDLANESAIMRQMCHNLLFAETRLKNADWNALFTALCKGRHGINETEQIIRAFCVSKRLLKGGNAKIIPERTMGRAVSKEQFCEMLVKLGYHADIDEARANLTMYVEDVPISDLPALWKARQISMYNMWSTFDLKEQDYPFGTPLANPAKILCMLGKDPDPSPVLLFEFRLPVNVTPRIPTFCDAYAGKIWSRYFRPALPGESYGTTMPTDTCSDKKGRPEVVHRTILLENLVKPVRTAI